MSKTGGVTVLKVRFGRNRWLAGLLLLLFVCCPSGYLLIAQLLLHTSSNSDVSGHHTLTRDMDFDWPNNCINQLKLTLAQALEEVEQVRESLKDKVKERDILEEGKKKRSRRQRICDEYNYLMTAKRVIIKNIFKSPQPDPGDVTIVSQTSLSRLNNLRKLYIDWSGPSSVALHVRYYDFIGLLPALTDLLNTTYTRLIHLHLLIDVRYNAMFPINQLRNVALREAVTSRVCLFDIDFVPSRNLYDSLKQTDIKPKQALVIPVFEFDDYLDFMFQPRDKAGLLKMVKTGQARPFHAKFYPPAQQPTNVERWYNATRAYQVEFQHMYEPFIYVLRENLPFYNEMLQYGERNKVKHISALDKLGYKFIVLPDVFLLHQEHRKLTKTRLTNQWKYRRCVKSDDKSGVEANKKDPSTLKKPRKPVIIMKQSAIIWEDEEEEEEQEQEEQEEGLEQEQGEEEQEEEEKGDMTKEVEKEIEQENKEGKHKSKKKRRRDIHWEER